MFGMTCSLRGYVQKMCRLYTGKDSLHMRIQPSYSLDNLHILPIQPPIFVLLRKNLNNFYDSGLFVVSFSKQQQNNNNKTTTTKNNWIQGGYLSALGGYLSILGGYLGGWVNQVGR